MSSEVSDFLGVLGKDVRRIMTLVTSGEGGYLISFGGRRVLWTWSG
jgi:hypothetical protein